MVALSHPAAPGPELPPRVRGYLDAIAQACNRELVSIVLFGSAAKGGFARQVSDVDLIVVLPDGASREERTRVHDEVSRLEIDHGFKEPAELTGLGNPLQAFAGRVCGNDFSCFVCARSDLLSGDVARVFDLKPVEALFVDRIVFANVIASSVTVWGEDLLPLVRPPHVRRLDVFKACFAFTNQVLLSLAAYGLLPNATRYAMGALKHSLHSCYFCYHLKTTALDEEVAFFQQRMGASQTSETLKRLLHLRGQYRKSFGFVLRCLPALLRLHLRTALDNSFPLEVRRSLPIRM